VGGDGKGEPQTAGRFGEPAFPVRWLNLSAKALEPRLQVLQRWR
jgi:hypothetical protein